MRVAVAASEDWNACMGKKKAKRDLTPEEVAAATRAKGFWDEKKKLGEITLSQTKAAEKCGWTQGAFWQYLNAATPLNWDAVIKLARLLSVEPADIYPELAEKYGVTPQERRSDLPPDALEIAHLYRRLGPKAQEHIRAFLRMAVTLSENGMDVNLEPDERYVEYENSRARDRLERRKPPKSRRISKN